MPAVIRACPARAGAELGLGEQSIQRGFECRFVERSSAQNIFGLRGAEGSPAAGTDGDANVFDDVILAFEPDGAIQDGKRDALRTHDPLEAGGLMESGKWQVKTNDEFFALLDGGFAGTEK